MKALQNIQGSVDGVKKQLAGCLSKEDFDDFKVAMGVKIDDNTNEMRKLRRQVDNDRDTFEMRMQGVMDRRFAALRTEVRGIAALTPSEEDKVAPPGDSLNVLFS